MWFTVHKALWRDAKCFEAHYIGCDYMKWTCNRKRQFSTNFWWWCTQFPDTQPQQANLGCVGLLDYTLDQIHCAGNLLWTVSFIVASFCAMNR